MKPELVELETWMEETEVGETSKEDYQAKLQELQTLLEDIGGSDIGGSDEGGAEPDIEEID